MDPPDSQFLFIFNPKTQTFRFAVCDILGRDDLTRITAILGPAFYSNGCFLIQHSKPSPLLEFNRDGQNLVIDAMQDRVIIGYQNTVWWQIHESMDPNFGVWRRTPLTDSGTDVELFRNIKTGQRIISVANVYGDEMKETLQTLYNKGARRFDYLGTAGGLDPQLSIGDVLLPKRFLNPDGKWFSFNNDGEKLILKFKSAKAAHATNHGWVGTLVEETKDRMLALQSQGVQAIDVEARYFAEFLNEHPSNEEIIIITISDIPLGLANYNEESKTRSIPTQSITQALPFILNYMPENNASTLNRTKRRALAGHKSFRPNLKQKSNKEGINHNSPLQ